MKRMVLSGISALMMFAAFATLPPDSHAQRGIGVTVGAAIPVGDLGDVSGTGASFGVDAFYHFLNMVPGLRAGGRVAYNFFSDNNYSQYGSSASSSASTIEIVPSLRYLFNGEDRATGYFAQAGFGMYITSVHFTDIPGTKDDTDVNFGLSLGVGATYQVFDTVSLVAMPMLNLSQKRYLSLNIGVIFGRREAKTADTPLESGDVAPESMFRVR